MNIGIVLVFLGMVGVDLVITTSVIFRPVRRWASKNLGAFGELFSCPQCMGVWVGTGCSFVYFWPGLSELDFLYFFSALLMGGAVSLVGFFTHHVQQMVIAAGEKLRSSNKPDAPPV